MMLFRPQSLKVAIDAVLDIHRLPDIAFAVDGINDCVNARHANTPANHRIFTLKAHLSPSTRPWPISGVRSIIVVMPPLVIDVPRLKVDLINSARVAAVNVPA